MVGFMEVEKFKIITQNKVTGLKQRGGDKCFRVSETVRAQIWKRESMRLWEELITMSVMLSTGVYIGSCY